MKNRFRKPVPAGKALLLLLGLLLALLVTWYGSRVQIVAAEGSSAVKRFELYATDGRLALPDGKEVYIWGFSSKNEPGTAVFPSPTLTVNEGDRVEVVLTNIGPKKEGVRKPAHTIHFHGLDTDQANDGVPHTSQAILVGESFTYRFTATHAGTYFYHCHVDTIEHMQMGMHGAFIVKAKSGSPEAWTGGPRYDRAYTFQLNEIDPAWHEAVEKGEAYDRTSYHPRYWTINGKSYPDTEKDPMSRVEGRVGDTILIRLINSGYESHSIHMHGFHFQVIASDGRPLSSPIGKDTINVGPAERYDILVKLTQSGHFPIHSHNITDNTNNGVYPGGMHTMMMVEPALPDATAKLAAGSKEAWVNGKRIALDTAPAVRDGQLYLPLTLLREATQAGLEVDKAAGLYTLTMKANELKFSPGRKPAFYNGKAVNLPVLPVAEKGAVLVPAKLAETYMGAKLKKGPSGEWTLTVKALPPSPSTTEEGTNAVLGGGQAEEPASHGAHEGPEHSNHSGGTAGQNGGSALPDGEIVEIDATSYKAQDLRIPAGTTVTWVNKDKEPHTATDLDGRFDSKSIRSGGRWSYTFKEKGSYLYYCSVHPTMQGTVTVE
ncbi:multicopper oxidase domain-containing protein [Cohnella sp. CFH 77786]|uniref:multicopper oxidase domain-containing protein n=1 Tax=Cohnella sp. CFH 77786 TaxID=2662265 RepID=UPI001C609343|nr:multicopper oxidase domain-containing protein [Cohnella sp. CFH 77786]MBW5444628.1 multicopper oxidase domain-containing protein [Cohnella sp. CFH 77786]